MQEQDFAVGKTLINLWIRFCIKHHLIIPPICIEILQSGNHFIYYNDIIAISTHIKAQYNAPALELEIIDCLELSDLGLYGQCLLASETAWDLFLTLVRFQKIFLISSNFSFTPNEQDIELFFTGSSAAFPEVFIHFCLAFIIKVAQLAFANPLLQPLKSAHLCDAHKKLSMAQKQLYVRYFGENLQWGTEKSFIVFDTNILTQEYKPRHMVNKREIIKQAMLQVKAINNHASPFLIDMLNILKQEAKEKTYYSLQQVAHLMHLPQASVERRLKEAGVTLTSLRQEVIDSKF